MRAGPKRLSCCKRKEKAPLSSSGLGYQVLILETRVRLPLGVLDITPAGARVFRSEAPAGVFSAPPLRVFRFPAASLSTHHDMIDPARPHGDAIPRKGFGAAALADLRQPFPAGQLLPRLGEGVPRKPGLGREVGFIGGLALPPDVVAGPGASTESIAANMDAATVILNTGYASHLPSYSSRRYPSKPRRHIIP